MFKILLVSLLLFSTLAVSSKSAEAYIDETRDSLLRVTGYKPVYFLMGKPNTRIQISLKAQIIDGLPVYMAYTQTLFWELFIESPYFSDIIYNPEFFYRINLGEKGGSLDISPLDHESNGRGGQLERSWNRAYIRYQNVTKFSERSSLFWSLKVWAPYTYNPSNPDLAQYRGVWEAVATLTNVFGPYFQKDDLTFLIYGGGESLINPLKGGQRLTLRAKVKSWAFLPLFVAQVFHGYSENLLNYKDETYSFRLGLGF